MFSCVLEDSERRPMGFGGFIAALADCLWTWFFGSSVLRGPVAALLQYQQREELPAEWISSGPHELSLCKVASLCFVCSICPVLLLFRQTDAKST